MKTATRKKKGLKIPQSVLDNPENQLMRVVVAYDAKRETLPYLYVLNGTRCHNTEHQIRKIYTTTTGCPYYQTRVILYETFVKRAKDKKTPIYFGNTDLNIVEI